MHPSPSYPVTYACRHEGMYPSIYTGDRLAQVLDQVEQQKCPPCNRAMHYQPPAGASDAELYAAKYERERLPTGHAAHMQLTDLTELWATCEECHAKKVRRLQSNPDVHVRDKANVMAERRGVK